MKSIVAYGKGLCSKNCQITIKIKIDIMKKTTGLPKSNNALKFKMLEKLISKSVLLNETKYARIRGNV